jgi:hypothetical protein
MFEDKIRVNDSETEKNEDTGNVFPWTNGACYAQMIQVNKYVQDVSEIA